MRVGFGSELPPDMASALAVSPDECDARFEERWRIGGFARNAVSGSRTIARILPRTNSAAIALARSSIMMS